MDIVDTYLIAKDYVGPVKLSKSLADVNSDDQINIIDTLLIAQYYVGLLEKLPGCKSGPIWKSTLKLIMLLSLIFHLN